VWAPAVVVERPGGSSVTLLLVTEWHDGTSFHLAWPWLTGDVHSGLREAYRLEDAAGRNLTMLDSRVQPLHGRMNEVTYFDTSGLRGAQTLHLRLRSRLAVPVEVPFAG
jgi:hypothetical protein